MSSVVLHELCGGEACGDVRDIAENLLTSYPHFFQRNAIGRDLSLSSSTVKVHISAALRALNVTTRTEAVIAAGRLGLRFDDKEGGDEP